MYSFLTKYGQIGAFVLGLALTAIAYIIIVSGFDAFSALPETPVDRRGETNIFNFGLVAPMILIGLCTLLAIGFGVYQMATNPKGSLVAIIGIAVIVILFFIFFSSTDPASSDSIRATLEEFNIDDTKSKFISGAIWTTIVLIAIAAASFVISEVLNLFK